MKETGNHRFTTTLADINRVPPEVQETIRAAYAATAWAFDHNAEKPLNPHKKPQDARDQAAVWRFGAWAEGQSLAQLHHDEGTNRTAHKAEWDAAVAAHQRKLDSASKAASTFTAGDGSHADQEAKDLKIGPYDPDFKKPEPVTAAIHGYVQHSDARQALVNRAKILEAQILAYIDELKTGISNEMGDVAADMAAYQAHGYQRLSVEAQTAKLQEFKERDTELNTALRWLSAGRTSIEVGFMEINRSTFRPKPVKLPE